MTEDDVDDRATSGDLPPPRSVGVSLQSSRNLSFKAAHMKKTEKKNLKFFQTNCIRAESGAEGKEKKK